MATIFRKAGGGTFRNPDYIDDGILVSSAGSGTKTVTFSAATKVIAIMCCSGHTWASGYAITLTIETSVDGSTWVTEGSQTTAGSNTANTGAYSVAVNKSLMAYRCSYSSVGINAGLRCYHAEELV